MKFEIPTLQEALQIIEANPSFYCKEEHGLLTFAYRLATYEDFENPKARELRGITYDKQNGNHYLSIHKFFNQNEYNKVMNRIEVIEAREKVDGSLITPIVLNNKVILKSKTSFTSSQATESTKLLSDNYKAMILDLYKDNLIPLFEYTSPQNQIVLFYPVDTLYLLQIRNNITGEYLPYKELEYIANKYDIKRVKIFNYTFDKLLELAKTKEELEGWVIWDGSNNPNHFRKIKTKWYFNLHRIVAPNNMLPHLLIQAFFNEKIDDVLSLVKGERRTEVLDVTNKLKTYVNNVNNIIDKIYKDEKELFIKDRKTFALKYKKSLYFPLLIRKMSTNVTTVDIIKDYTLKKINTQKKAEIFLENIEGGKYDK